MKRCPDTAARKYLTQTRAANSPAMTSTSCHFTGVLKGAEITISMDGRGRCMDNIFIERPWRSLRYEAVYLRELTHGFVAEGLSVTGSTSITPSVLIRPLMVKHRRKPMELRGLWISGQSAAPD